MELASPNFLIKPLLAILLIFFLHHIRALSPSTSLSSFSFFPRKALPTKTGYLSINTTTISAMFYVFYEAQKPISPLLETLLIIWLQGSPSCTSMVGNFFELGPSRVKEHNASSDLHLALEWNPGESYAGKYVRSIGYYILKNNPRLLVPRRLNLSTVAIGNRLTDPVTQVATHAVHAYYSGLINERQKNELEKVQWEAINLTKMENWRASTNARVKVLDMLQSMTDLVTLNDVTKKVPYKSEFLQIEEVKKALGVKQSMDEICSDVVAAALHDDFMKSVRYMVELLVKKGKVVLYQGNFDLKDSVVSTEAWVKTMRWDGLGEFLMAERKVWTVNGGVCGYLQKWGNLSQVVVLGARHLVPSDQTLSSQAMIEDWVFERGLFGYEEEVPVEFPLFDK